MVKQTAIRWAAISGILTLWAGNAWGVGSSGYENATLSTRSLSRANAVVADPRDPSTVAFNPAGLTELEGTQIYVGSNLLWTDYDYKGESGRPDSDASRTLIPVPFAYASIKPKDSPFAVGVGSNSPFGLITKYNSIGNFQRIAYYNELKAAQYGVSAAYEINDKVSIGAGWSLYDVSLKQVGKFNTDAILGALGFGTGPDADFEYDVDGQGQGWNAGVFWKVTDNDNLGLFYRSQARIHFKGSMSTHNLVGLMQNVFGVAGSTSLVTSVDSDWTFPHNVTIGWSHTFSEKLEMELDLGWTGWSAYDSVKTLFGTQKSNGVLNGFSDLSKDYRDTISVHVGGTYTLDEDWKINGGYYFQQMAANKANYSNEIPDGDRHGFTLGFEHKLGDRWTFDMNYLIAISAPVDVTNTVGDSNGTDIDGEYSGLVQDVTMGLRTTL
jgi:long-chain fatty acid transport protein